MAVVSTMRTLTPRMTTAISQPVNDSEREKRARRKGIMRARVRP